MRPMTGRSGQKPAKELEVNRLDQVVFEARGARPLSIFWLEIRGQCEGRWAVMGHLHGVSIEHRQETRQAGGRVLVVVHDEDAATVIDCSRPLAIATTRFGFHRRQGVREDRQPDEELAAPARAIALL